MSSTEIADEDAQFELEFTLITEPSERPVDLMLDDETEQFFQDSADRMSIDKEDTEASWLKPPLKSSGSTFFSYRWIAEGRLAIRHDANPDRVYVLPIKHPNSKPMHPSSMQTASTTFMLDLENTQRFKSSLGGTTGPRTQGRRSGHHHREAMSTKLLLHSTGLIEEHTFLNGVEWKARVVDRINADQVQVFEHYQNVMPNESICRTLLVTAGTKKLKLIPATGFWVLEHDFSPSVWARGGGSGTLSQLESYGPSILAFRSKSGAISKHIIKRLHYWTRCVTEDFGPDHPKPIAHMDCPKKNNNQRSVHMGSTAHYSADSWSSKSKVSQLTIDTIRQKHPWQSDAVRGLLKAVREELSPVISEYLRLLDPAMWQYQMAMRERWLAMSKEEPNADLATLADLGGCFMAIAVNKGRSKNTHVDTTDYRKCYAFVIPLGNFTGGEMVLSREGFKVPLQPGQFFMFCASFLPHFVDTFTKDRYSLTLFTDFINGCRIRDVLLKMGLSVGELDFAFEEPAPPPKR